MAKIIVEWRATVTTEHTITAKQKRQLESGELRLDDILDERTAYRALATEGEFEPVDWDDVPRRGKRKGGV